jgi:hypothetical protein
MGRPLLLLVRGESWKVVRGNGYGVGGTGAGATGRQIGEAEDMRALKGGTRVSNLPAGLGKCLERKGDKIRGQPWLMGVF